MTALDQTLADLESRVVRRYADLIVDTIPADIFNPEEWLYGDTWKDATKAVPAQQFPREQWITYPNRRVAILILVDHSLDHWDNLNQEQRWHIDFLLAYGGRERIA